MAQEAGIWQKKSHNNNNFMASAEKIDIIIFYSKESSQPL